MARARIRENRVFRILVLAAGGRKRSKLARQKKGSQEEA